MTAMSYFLESVLPFSVMVALELISVGLNTLFKAATLQGMSYHVFVVYDYATAALVLLPAVYISRRSTTALPPLTSRMIWKICLLGIIGDQFQFTNTVFSLKQPHSSFYIHICRHVQTQIMEEYPAELTVTFLYDLVVCVFAAVVALIAEGTSSNAWLLSSRIAFASVLCSGVFGSCMSNAIDAWALRVKGPLFVAMFSPFSMVIAVVMGVVFLGDPLLLGSLIGATIISAGFYMLMWGKAKEIDNSETKLEEDPCHNSSSLQAPQSGEDVHAPLLQSYKTEQV
ncbi:unnamed protein product [Linum tenue]|uniref:WAT1-related protein n=1 Tax=Linum tenue TaxID=586396 RepID=A0AAV0NBQ5_9ROSI|nr:unnamed protein product [Linum tenue]